MKRHIVWILAFSMLSGILGFSSLSLAVGDKWIKKADMPTARNGLSTSVVNERLYAVGGSNFQLGGSLSTLEEYSPRFLSLGVEAKGKLPTSWGRIKYRY